jgi:predicted RNA-binding protein with PUA-like domain
MPPSPSAPRSRAARYWLLKSEPDVFSFDDLWAAPARTTSWDGVRNYQARNSMRDDMRVGDLALFYHSSAEPPAVVGVVEIVRAAYPDETAFDPTDPHFDPKSRREAPTWVTVDVRATERFARPVTLPELRATPGLEGMELLRRGSRLSVQPVRPSEWEIVRALGTRGAEPPAGAGR